MLIITIRKSIIKFIITATTTVTSHYSYRLLVALV